jgi:nitrogenase molybdenum-iron protein alpha/beta subunit
MGFYKYYPLPSDRMGAIWTLLPIKGAYILEFGTSGTTRYTLNGFARIQGEENCKVYTTHLEETDIAMGDIKRLDSAIETIIEKENPPVVFVMPSTISSVIGTDIEAYCKIYREKFPDTQIIYVKSDGFGGNWTLGVEDTLNLLVSHLTVECIKSDTLTFNLIGSCVDDYNYLSDTLEIVRLLKGSFGATPLCIMTSNTHMNDIKNMSSAHFNLVLRKEGLLAAQMLKEKYGTPYVYGKPYGLKGTLDWLNEISKTIKKSMDDVFIEEETIILENTLKQSKNLLKQRKIVMGGSIDTIKGLADFANEAGFYIKHMWCNVPDLEKKEIPFFQEKKWEGIILEGDYDIVMGNAIALGLAKPVAKKIQIDIPNYKFSPIQNSHNPYVGFQGALNLLGLWINP